ncbi:MAG TPA: hypothetical protein VFW42_07720 [Fluviicoccus sp.]|nr:hypothetical protein [Fluviicoccus sp.]
MNGHYVFAWDARRHGLPKDYAAAAAMAKELYDKQDGEPGEGLPLFADAVDAYLREYGDEDCLEQFLWDLPKRARSNGRAAMRMEMPYEDWEHILVKMVEEAARHQVVLVDEEMVMVFLPDGKVLPAARKKVWRGLCAAWGPDVEFPKSKGQFKKWFEPQFLRVLGKYGDFKRGKEGDFLAPTFNRSFEKTRQFSDFEIEGGGGTYSVDVWFVCAHQSVAEIAHKFKFIDQELVFSEIIFRTFFSDPYEGRHVTNVDDARGLLRDLDETLGKILPLCESIQGLDSLLNGEVDIRFRDHFHNYVYMPQCLIVARLAGNPHFEELVVTLGSTDGWYANGEYKENEWPKLVEYLRNEVKPII